MNTPESLPGENINVTSNPGTSGRVYRLWIDYIYDRFDATLDRPMQRYMVSFGIASVLFFVALCFASLFGLGNLYLTSPGVYIVFVAFVWVTNALRWLSQTYHVRTNLLRRCFLIPDDQYQAMVTQFASNATNNKRIFAISFCVSLAIWLYLVVLFFAPDAVRQTVLVGFPRSMSAEWHTGGNLVPKLVLLAYAATLASLPLVTGAFIMFETMPLYFKLANLPVIPMPNHVTIMWSGVLRLYQSGALMWSFGVLLAELIYGVQLDILDVLFVVSISFFGLLAFLQPRRALTTLLKRSRALTFNMSFERYFAIRNLPDSVREVLDLDAAVRGVLPEPRGSFNVLQILASAGSQLVPILPFIAKAATSLIFVH